MTAIRLGTLRTVFADLESLRTGDVLFLPEEGDWHLDVRAAVVGGVDLDQPDAEVDALTRGSGLTYALGIAAIQDIAENLHLQGLDASPGELLVAFRHYRRHDAFIDWNAEGHHRP